MVTYYDKDAYLWVFAAIVDHSGLNISRNKKKRLGKDCKIFK